MHKWCSKLALFLVFIYRISLSFFLGGNCRYYPSCSCYAEKAYNVHGFFKASKLVLKRVISCHPFGSEGYDPVPEGKQNV
ncbi:MAG: membrane protein insertion efficiency factor YidD [Bdellovibrionales bacterium RBG_16_40_8]|nr:MAG: membrane protein insertion efficiency factor YidD [Bdellovibrionales bacterium RBG_16_40_8]